MRFSHYDGKQPKQTGGGSTITIDSELSEISVNPVQNKVVTNAINELNSNVNNLQMIDVAWNSGLGTNESVLRKKSGIVFVSIKLYGEQTVNIPINTLKILGTITNNNDKPIDKITIPVVNYPINGVSNIKEIGVISINTNGEISIVLNTKSDWLIQSCNCPYLSNIN